MADPIETTDADVEREIKEAAGAAIKAARTRTPPDIADAAKQLGEAIYAVIMAQWPWQKIVAALIVAGAAVLASIGTVTMLARQPVAELEAKIDALAEKVDQLPVKE